MNVETPPNTLYVLLGATQPNIAWEPLYDAAVASGRERCMSVSEERIAACDELLARSFQELVRLSRYAALASRPTPADKRRRFIERSSAGLIRLLDRALAAYARERQQDISDARAAIASGASFEASELFTYSTADPWPLPSAVDRTAHHLARALTAYTHDRKQLPEHITMAAAELLVIYAAVCSRLAVDS